MSNNAQIFIALIFTLLSHVAAFYIGWMEHKRMTKPKVNPISPVKPCPHCGSRELRFELGYHDKVVCKSCGFFMSDIDFRKAVKKWNKSGGR